MCLLVNLDAYEENQTLGGVKVKVSVIQPPIATPETMTCDVQELREFLLAILERSRNAVPFAPPRPFLFSLIA